MVDQTELYRRLMEAAVHARAYAYSPYSHYRVGAALLCAHENPPQDGSHQDGCHQDGYHPADDAMPGVIYTGCNVENAGYSATNCAERTAIFKAVSEGARTFLAIAIVGGMGDELSPSCTPCGICRQVMAEFCTPDFPIILGTPEQLRVCTLGELLPFSFSGDEL